MEATAKCIPFSPDDLDGVIAYSFTVPAIRKGIDDVDEKISVDFRVAYCECGWSVLR